MEEHVGILARDRDPFDCSPLLIDQDPLRLFRSPARVRRLSLHFAREIRVIGRPQVTEKRPVFAAQELCFFPCSITLSLLKRQHDVDLFGRIRLFGQSRERTPEGGEWLFICGDHDDVVDFLPIGESPHVCHPVVNLVRLEFKIAKHREYCCSHRTVKPIDGKADDVISDNLWYDERSPHREQDEEPRDEARDNFERPLSFDGMAGDESAQAIHISSCTSFGMGSQTE